MPQRVDFDRHAAQRGHGVDQQQRAGVVDDCGDLFDRLPGAGRSFGHDDADHLRLRHVDGPSAISSAVKTSPQGRSMRVTLAPARSATSPIRAPKTPLTHDDHRVARLDEIDDRRFHAGRAGAAHRERHPVLRAEQLAQAALQLVHDLQVVRIEVPDRRPRQRGEHARVDVARAGAEQRADGRIERGEVRAWCTNVMKSE